MSKLLLTLFGLILSWYLYPQTVCTTFTEPTTLTPTPNLISHLQVKGILPNPCIGNPVLPDPTLINVGCFGAMERYLSRPVIVDDLLQGLNYQINPNGPGGLNGYPGTNSLEPYFDDIGLLVEMKATHAMLAGKQYGGGSAWNPDGDFYKQVRQVVTDIYYAFDCAHLRRPLIQGTIYETFSNFNVPVKICPDLIKSFLDAGDPALQPGLPTRDRYIDNMGFPRTDVFFETEKIVFTTANGPSDLVPDISKIECRLWFLHVAKMYIDAGYNSMAMGQISIWGAADPGYNNTNRTLTLIREYAKQNGTFMLMTAEPHLGGPEPVVADLNHPGENLFLWDYDSRPLRPREITTPPHQDPELNTPPCNGGYDISATQIFEPGQPCNSDKAIAAIIDLCHLENFSHRVSGYNPSGCYYEELPFVVYFDYGPGEFYPNPNNPGENGWAGPGSYPPTAGTWGYSDSNWLAELSPDCQAAWLSAVACRIRDLTHGLGFFQIPGRVLTPQRYGPNSIGANTWDIPPYSHNSYSSFQQFYYRMKENPNVVKALQEALEPDKMLEVEYSTYCKVVDCSPRCRVREGELEPMTYAPGKWQLIKRKTHRFCVKEPDCTSTYTWHIRRSDGTWLPFYRGECFEFTPDQSGTYIIGLRQDNLALEYSTFGAAIIPADITINVQIPDSDCSCQEVSEKECSESDPFAAICVSASSKEAEYNFTITMPADAQGEYVHLLARQGHLVQYEYMPQTNEVVGKLTISRASDSRIVDMTVRYSSSNPDVSMGEFDIYQELQICRSEFRTMEVKKTSFGYASLLPVPADNVLSVITGDEFEEPNQFYRIINSAGKIVQNGLLYEPVSDVMVGGLASGVYFLQLIYPMSGKQQQLRFIIAR